jgi:hypothetical protein
VVTCRLQSREFAQVDASAAGSSLFKNRLAPALCIPVNPREPP